MHKQRGYYNLDVTGMFVGIAIIAAVVGVVIWEILSWLWPMIKTIIHNLTA